MRLYDQLSLYVNVILGRIFGHDRVFAELREVLQQVFLPRVLRLVFICPICGLLGLIEVLVEDSEVGAGYPDCARPVHRCAEHAALLDVLPFTRGQLERLRLGERW